MSAALLLGSLAAGLIGELLAPTSCCACDVRVAPRVLFCPSCAASVERADPRGAREGSAAAFDYGGATITAVTRLKYEDRADLAPRLASAMSYAAQRFAGTCDVVVPVPLHPRRLAERGYNQAALLAAPIARALAIDFAPRALVRVRDTPKQALLERKARLENVNHAFIPRERALLEGRRVLLVDDVCTTGATLEGCTTALHEVGVWEVRTLVLARRA